MGALEPVRSLLFSILLLMGGAGVISALVGVRLEAAGSPALVIGLVGAGYFAGLTLGSLRAGRIVARVGHIRAFAAFVTLLSASTLAYSLAEQPLFWGALRILDGLCVAGVYICLESWLNERAEPRARGFVLAAYMVALYAGQAVSQFLLQLGEGAPAMPLVAASILISLAIIPISLTRSRSPELGEPAPLPLSRLYAVSPLGLAGAAIAGAMLGAFYALGAVYARRSGLSLPETAGFMSAVIAGGVALQWPIGWLSDRFDRRRVIVGVFAATAAIALALAAAGGPGAGLIVMGALFGGLSFSLYPLCVAHANDHVSAPQRVGASAGLVMAYSAGAAAGPVIGAAAMSALGAAGLFGFIAAASASAVGFGLWRMRARPPVPEARQQEYRVRPSTSPMAAALDPTATEER